MSWLSVKNLKKNYGTNPVLRGIDLDIHQKELCVLRGASGSGKSTLLYLLGGLDQATSGLITIQGKNLHQFNSEELARYRNLFVGFVFQFHFLLPSMTAKQNCLLPAQIGGHEINTVLKRIERLAKHLNVFALLDKYPHQLSGGEQQRINIIRALSLEPSLLLCDEPTGNLDSKNSQLVTELLIELSQATGATLIVVTHDDKVASFFPRKISIEDGQIIS
jgi:lipoprotein-releasing system ATP-binding protein